MKRLMIIAALTALPVYADGPGTPWDRPPVATPSCERVGVLWGLVAWCANRPRFTCDQIRETTPLANWPVQCRIDDSELPEVSEPPTPTELPEPQPEPEQPEPEYDC